MADLITKLQELGNVDVKFCLVETGGESLSLVLIYCLGAVIMGYNHFYVGMK